MSDDRYPILGKGEVFSEAVSPTIGGGPKQPIRTFEEAREILLPKFNKLLNQIHQIDEKYRISRIYFTVSLDYTFLAKSYFPITLINRSQWELAGSKAYYQTNRNQEKLRKSELSRNLYFCATPSRIEDAYERLHKANDLIKKEREDFAKIDNISLPKFEEKISNIGEDFIKGIIELIFHPMRKNEWEICVKKFERVLVSLGKSKVLNEWMRGGDDSPIFLPALIDKKHVPLLGNFNPLRTARLMPRISFPRIKKEKILKIGNPPIGPVLRTQYPEVGIFDGGVDGQVPHLRNWVVPIDLTEEKEQLDFLEHGTAVCGAVLYGPITLESDLPQPKFKVKSFRIFPVPRINGLNLDLYQVLDWIKQQVEDPKNKHIKTYILSFGPDYPVNDMEIDLFTITLDQLAYDFDILFVVAAGNRGEELEPLNRIQPPSDVVNGLGVGAFILDDGGVPVPADYSCVGPGRPGSQVKPDVCAFGGSPEQPFYVLLARTEGEVSNECGTSFSAPLVGANTSHLLYRTPDPDIITPQTAKAIIVHNAIRYGNWDAQHGWGAIYANIDDIMTCASNEVKVIYNGVIDFTRCVRLTLPFPDNLDFRGKVYFEWTIAFACGVCPATPDEYTLAGCQIYFRPNQKKYRYKYESQSKILEEGSSIASKLQAIGWEKSRHPVTQKFKREQKLREEGKWDTILKCSCDLEKDNIYLPILDIHALARADWATNRSPGRINYAAVVTVKVNDPSVKLYERVRERMPQLVQVRLRERARRRV